MIKRLFAVTVLSATVLAWAAPSAAGTIAIDLHNTAHGLGLNGDLDPNWVVVGLGQAEAWVGGAPLAGEGEDPVIDDLWIPAWDPNVAQWITPFSETLTLGPGGIYEYETTFFLPDNFTSAAIDGVWATDDFGLAIELNGASTGNSLLTNGAYSSRTPFSITSGFQAGLNTLTFVVFNEGDDTPGPTGLYVEMNGTAEVPDGGTTLVLLGGALLGLGAVRRRFGR